MSKPALEMKAIFAHAFELESPAERERYLADACRDNARLRGEVEGLLRAFAGAGDSSESHVFSTMTSEESHAADLPSTRANASAKASSAKRPGGILSVARPRM